MKFIPPLAPTPEAVFLLNAGGASCYSKFMRLFLFAFAAAFLCAGVFGAQIGADESRISAEVYVSSTHGDDANDGSRDKPLKTFAKIPKKDARIFLRKGDVFYEPLAGLENCVVDSYGRGSKKPLVCGLRIIKNPSAWENMGGGIWRLDMDKTENFAGRNPPAKDRGKLFNNIGGIYDMSTDELHGRVLRKHSDLKEDWDMIVSSEFRREKVTPETFRYLHLKLGRNPAEFGSLALIAYGNGISGLRNCTVRNVAIKGFGRHGLTGCRGGRIENLEIDLIGGSVLVGFPNWVRLGNGIEFWINSPSSGSNIHNRVTGCVISRTFDCGSTIQGRAQKGKNVAEDIVFTGNKYYRCRQAFEHWLSGGDAGRDPIEYKDCKFVGNFAWEMGDNGFNSPYLQDLNFLSYDRKPAAMTIRDNVCYGAGAYAGTANRSSDFGGNTFYVLRGKPLLVELRGGKGKNLVVPANSEEDIKKYREISGDSTSKISIVDESDAALREKLLGGDFKYVKKILKKAERETGKQKEDI